MNGYIRVMIMTNKEYIIIEIKKLLLLLKIRLLMIKYILYFLN